MAESTVTRLSSGRPSVTAEITAQLRAVDAALRPARRLVNDQYAHHFVTNPWYPLLRLTPGVALVNLRTVDRLLGGMLAEILLRGPYFEEVLAGNVDAGVRQVILLGAGYDTTALRVAQAGPAQAGQVRFVEVDHPATQQVKRRILGRIGGEPDSVTFVPADLERDSLPEALAAAVDFGAPSVVGWLGVSYYLSPASFQGTLHSIAEVCAPGSTLVFDYMDPAVIDGTTRYRAARRAARSVQRRGEPYTLGLTPQAAADAAAAAGFRLVESMRVTDLVRRYGGDRPYCCDDDYMGVLQLTRVEDGT